MQVSPALFRLFGWLPATVASGFGARVGPLYAPRRMPLRAERARRNLALLRPDLDKAGRAALLAQRWRNMGRFTFELPVMDQLNRPDSVAVSDPVGFAALIAIPRPVVFISLHLGNWELLGAYLMEWARPAMLGIFEPPPDAAQAALLDHVRRGFLDRMVKPGAGAARRIVRALTHDPGAAVFILLDERRDFQVDFPFFGRAADRARNLSIALRIAATTDALIVPLWMERHPRACFSLNWGSPIDLRETDAAAAATALNSYFEPLTIAHADQWLALQDMTLE